METIPLLTGRSRVDSYHWSDVPIQGELPFGLEPDEGNENAAHNYG